MSKIPLNAAHLIFTLIILYQFVHEKHTVIFRGKFEFQNVFHRKKLVKILLENCGLGQNHLEARYYFNFINDNNNDNTQAAIIIILLLMIIIIISCNNYYPLLMIIRKLQ